MTVKFLELSSPDRSIAYNLTEAKNPKATLVFLCGLMSDMEGTKALYIEEYAKQHGLSFLRFDYQGHGQSSGEFVDGSITLWQQDTLAVIDELTSGPVVLIGSSMGGWQMLLAALNRPDRIKALVGIAPAPDFTQELMEDQLAPDAIKQLDGGSVYELIPEPGASGYPITRRFLDDGRDNNLLNKSINITAPLHILHGIQDTSVPPEVSARIMQHVVGEQVYLHLIKDGDHRLSRDQDLQLLSKVLDTVLA